MLNKKRNIYQMFELVIYTKYGKESSEKACRAGNLGKIKVSQSLSEEIGEQAAQFKP